MTAWARMAIAIGAFALGALSGGCTADSGAQTARAVAGPGGWTPSSSGSSATVPTLVVVDANRTMSAAPGQGVGVFVEYATGGHWHVWWTCDTDKTGQGCTFDNTVSASSGALTNVSGQALAPSDRLLQLSPEQIEVLTYTSTAIQGVDFDTAPGAAIALDARLNDVEDGAILFFVQDGLVNGGYTGTVGDPLTLEPSAP